MFWSAQTGLGVGTTLAGSVGVGRYEDAALMFETCGPNTAS
jgi:hypothetical protein